MPCLERGGRVHLAFYFLHFFSSSLLAVVSFYCCCILCGCSTQLSMMLQHVVICNLAML